MRFLNQTLRNSLLALFFGLFAFSAHAQEATYPEAVVTHELYVMLRPVNSGDEQAADIYRASLKDLAFSTEAEAVRFFSHFGDEERVQFDVNFASEEVLIHLSEPTGEQWSVEKWAMYFKYKVADQRKAKGFVDFRKM
jgi:hypothetical protein